MRLVRWAILDNEGTLIKGEGPKPGLTDLVRDAKASALLAVGLPPLFIAAGATLEWTVERDALNPAHKLRFWGVKPVGDQRLWIWPDGSMIGLGDQIEDVITAMDLLNGRLEW